jgi:putative glutathione S-transferase
LQKDIEKAVEWIYQKKQLGVYKCGFASTQEDYKKAYHKLFQSLDGLEDMLEGH